MPGDMTGLNGSGACDSIIRIELITHFHRNPCMEGTPEEVSEAIGRDRARVEAQLKKLVQLRILQEKVRGGEIYYRYLPPLAVANAEREESRCVEAGEAAAG